MDAKKDSRPFAVLRQTAEDFKNSFENDVENCLGLLDSKISALLCDPDSLLSSSPSHGMRLSAPMEFSRAKYEIFVNMKTHFDALESNWQDQISVMKDSFLENVEIFLAGTKLEIKLPSAEKRRSPAVSRVQKGKQESPSTSSSIKSLYPSFLDTAKCIRGLGSLLSGAQNKDQDSGDSEEEAAVATPLRHGRTPKRVTINTSPTIREFLATSKIMDKEEDMESEEDEEEATSKIMNKEEDMEYEEDGGKEFLKVPLKRNERAAKRSAVSSPAIKRTPATPTIMYMEDDVEAVVKKNERATRKSAVNTPTSSKNTPVKSSLRRRNLVNNDPKESSSSEEEDVPPPEPEVKTTRRGARTKLSNQAVPSPAKGRKGRTAKKKNQVTEELEINEMRNSFQVNGGKKEAMVLSEADKTILGKNNSSEGSPKDVQFSVGFDVTEDLDIYSPEVNIAKSRRKTMLNRMAENFEDVNLTPDVLRSKSKRKTIAGDIPAPSPKRLKKGSRGSIVPSKLAMEPDDTMESNLLEGDEAAKTGHYSQWIPLADVGAIVPAQPGVYELKVSAAKKPAYIGACDSLRQKLTQHKLVQNSGHKHLDKFIERNIANVLVRYEQLPSVVQAKTEEKNRVKSFVTLYKNTPAYN